MPTPTVFDPEPLLAPIGDDEPAGKRPTILDRNKLKEYRDDFDPERDLSEEDRRNPTMSAKEKVIPQWDKIISFGKNYFEKTGKDLTVAMPMVEALARKDGFAGLRDGLVFVRRLCEECWDRMYPVIEDASDPEEMEGRVAPFTFIDDEVNSPRFPNTVRGIPLLYTAEGVAVSFANCQSYESNAQPLVSQDEFRATVTSASMEQVELIRQYDEDLTAAISELQALVAVLDEKAGSNAPGLGGLRKAIDDCQSISKQVIHLRGGATSNGSNEESTDGSSDETSGGKGGGSAGGGGGTALGAVRNREDVYARLNELTLLLEQFEPHSPVPFMIRRAIEMRSMRFPELVDTLTSQKQVLEFIRVPIADGMAPAE